MSTATVEVMGTRPLVTVEGARIFARSVRRDSLKVGDRLVRWARNGEAVIETVESVQDWGVRGGSQVWIL